MIYEKFDAAESKQTTYATASILKNRKPRSLIFGQTDDRNFLHIYLDTDQLLKKVVYDPDRILVSETTELDDLMLADCIPSLKSYPEKCDFEFCEVLLAHRVFLPFTMYAWLDQEQWFGLKFEQLITSVCASDFHLDFQVSYADLGLDRRKLSHCAELDAWLTSTFNKQMTGYLRSIALRADPSVEQWFYCIGVLFENRVSSHYRGELPADFGVNVGVLCEQAKRACLLRIKQLNKRELA